MTWSTHVYLWPPSASLSSFTRHSFPIRVKVSLLPAPLIIASTHHFDYTNPHGARRPLHIDWYLLSLVSHKGKMGRRECLSKRITHFFNLQNWLFLSRCNGDLYKLSELLVWLKIPEHLQTFLLTKLGFFFFFQFRRNKEGINTPYLILRLERPELNQYLTPQSHVRGIKVTSLSLFFFSFFYPHDVLCISAKLIW